MPVRIIESGRIETDWAAGFTDNLARNQGRDDIAAKLSVMAPDFYVHRTERIWISQSPTDGRADHASDNSATSHVRAIRCGSSVEANINGGWVQSFGTRFGIVATVTGDGTIVPTIGNQGWLEYGGRLGLRITKGWIADLFVNGTAGPQSVGNTIHGGVGLRISY